MSEFEYKCLVVPGISYKELRWICRDTDTSVAWPPRSPKLKSACHIAWHKFQCCLHFYAGCVSNYGVLMFCPGHNSTSCWCLYLAQGFISEKLVWLVPHRKMTDTIRDDWFLDEAFPYLRYDLYHSNLWNILHVYKHEWLCFLLSCFVCLSTQMTGLGNMAIGDIILLISGLKFKVLNFYHRIISNSHFYIYINSSILIVLSWIFCFIRLYTRPNNHILPITVHLLLFMSDIDWPDEQKQKWFKCLEITKQVTILLNKLIQFKLWRCIQI